MKIGSRRGTADWKAIRRGSAEEEVRKHRDRVTGAWKQISKQRRRVDVSFDPSMVTALQHGTWIDKEGSKRTCIKEQKKRGGIHQPLYGTWVEDFMLRQDAGRFMLFEHIELPAKLLDYFLRSYKSKINQWGSI